jgi:hypothetical protein
MGNNNAAVFLRGSKRQGFEIEIRTLFFNNKITNIVLHQTITGAWASWL